MKHEQKTENDKNVKAGPHIDPLFFGLGITAEHIAIAMDILADPTLYEVRYLRNAPVVKKPTTKKDEPARFSDYEMTRGDAYGCVIIFDIDHLADEVTERLDISSMDDAVVGWAKSKENYVTSKMSIKLHAILRGLVDQPYIEVHDEDPRVFGSTSKKMVPEDIRTAIVYSLDHGWSG